MVLAGVPDDEQAVLLRVAVPDHEQVAGTGVRANRVDRLMSAAFLVPAGDVVRAVAAVGLLALHERYDLAVPLAARVFRFVTDRMRTCQTPVDHAALLKVQGSLLQIVRSVGARSWILSSAAATVGPLPLEPDAVLDRVPASQVAVLLGVDPRTVAAERAVVPSVCRLAQFVDAMTDADKPAQEPATSHLIAAPPARVPELEVREGERTLVVNGIALGDFKEAPDRWRAVMRLVCARRAGEGYVKSVAAGKSEKSQRAKLVEALKARCSAAGIRLDAVLERHRSKGWRLVGVPEKGRAEATARGPSAPPAHPHGAQDSQQSRAHAVAGRGCRNP